MAIRRTARALLFGAVLAAPLSSQSPAPVPRDPLPPVPDEAAVAKAVQEAADLLVELQENYVEERRPPRRLRRDEEQLAAWRRKEAARVEKLRAERGPPREWPYEGVYRERGSIPPGYRVGGTAIACWALLEAPGLDERPERRKAFERGVEFVLHELENNEALDGDEHGGYDVRVWGQAYGLLLLAEVRAAGRVPASQKKRVDRVMRDLIRRIQGFEIPKRGGWNYARRGLQPSTFMTASVLQALFAARAQDFAVDAGVVERALDALDAARLRETGAYQYAVREKKTGKGFEAVAGASARMAIVETTLLMAGRGSPERLREAVKAFFENWGWLEARRSRTGTHLPPYMIAPYYYHYGHTYAAQAIERLPEKERPALRARLRQLYWKTREDDGGWNDRVFPRSKAYGTAMTILGLTMP